MEQVSNILECPALGFGHQREWGRSVGKNIIFMGVYWCAQRDSTPRPTRSQSYVRPVEFEDPATAVDFVIEGILTPSREAK